MSKRHLLALFTDYDAAEKVASNAGVANLF